MNQKNQIGLEPAETGAVANLLNDLLANYQLFYINLRGYHWNIRGDKFFELHAKFEELYTSARIKIDEVAERVLTLGYTPLHSYSDYLKSSDIPEDTGISDSVAAVNSCLKGFKVLLVKQREILKLSADADDEGTNALMSDYIREQEKTVWMYSSFLSRK